jgi:hypothetical protein
VRIELFDAIMCVSVLVVDVHVMHMLVSLLWLGLQWRDWLVLLGGACGLAGMVLMVLGYVLRSPTFGWTGAACCVTAEIVGPVDSA